jgi:pilus assembly protein CpaE
MGIGGVSALMISPNRELGEMFLHSVAKSRLFEVIGDLKAYPAQQALDVRLRQLRPDVVLVDLSTNLDEACELIRYITSLPNSAQAIGIHLKNDSEAILRSLRVGAVEFLYAPFDVSIQEACVNRIVRLIQPEGGTDQNGKIVVFSSTKPGSGASTLASQTAFALRRATGKRVLLADFDLLGGSLGFLMKLEHDHSVMDLLRFTDRLDKRVWSDMVAHSNGVDVLPAPELPWNEPVDPSQLHQVLQFARRLYDFVVVDLPSIYHRISLLSISESDRAYLISTSELASLHLARRAVKLLTHLGFDSQRYQVLINRIDAKRDELNISDLGKLFDCAVDASLPNDYLSLHRAVTQGEAVDPDSDLGKAIEGLAVKLHGAVAPRPAQGTALRTAWNPV